MLFCLVNHLHHHKLEYMHIDRCQVQHSDHMAVQTAAYSARCGTADARGLLLFGTVAENFTCTTDVSDSHHHHHGLRRSQEPNRNIKQEHRESYRQQPRASGKAVMAV